MPENSSVLVEHVQEIPEELSGIPAQVQLLCDPGQPVEEAAFEHIHHYETRTVSSLPGFIDLFAFELVEQRAGKWGVDEQYVRNATFETIVDYASRLRSEYPGCAPEIRRRVMMWFCVLKTNIPLEQTGF